MTSTDAMADKVLMRTNERETKVIHECKAIKIGRENKTQAYVSKREDEQRVNEWWGCHSL